VEFFLHVAAAVVSTKRQGIPANHDLVSSEENWGFRRCHRLQTTGFPVIEATF